GIHSPPPEMAVVPPHLSVLSTMSTSRPASLPAMAADIAAAPDPATRRSTSSSHTMLALDAALFVDAAVFADAALLDAALLDAAVLDVAVLDVALLDAPAFADAAVFDAPAFAGAVALVLALVVSVAFWAAFSAMISPCNPDIVVRLLV